MVTKEILYQYSNLKREHKELQEKIEKLEKEIERMEEEGSTVEVVTGGYGGSERFSVSGVPSAEYSRKKTLLYARKATLASLDVEIYETINLVEEFIAGIDDSRIRRIINLRFLQNMTWSQVSAHFPNLTQDSIRISFERFMEKG